MHLYSLLGVFVLAIVVKSSGAGAKKSPKNTLYSVQYSKVVIYHIYLFLLLLDGQPSVTLVAAP